MISQNGWGGTNVQQDDCHLPFVYAGYVGVGGVHGADGSFMEFRVLGREWLGGIGSGGVDGDDWVGVGEDTSSYFSVMANVALRRALERLCMRWCRCRRG